ncbi:MAG TPA: 3-oxoacid CoA-transferase subunit B [Dehalococcoidia bacterium]|nr:3-oxoacid CoA-transferase subunit B [Dehalococcoidia bacterium]
MPGEKLDEVTMAMRAAREFEDGMLVNLGVGIPTLASSYVLPGREVIFHSENGVIGFGPLVEDPSQADPYLINASVQPVSPLPGMCFVSHEEAFAMIRGGHVDLTVLGALQVAENGDLANYHLPGKVTGSFGGGQDLAFCAKRVVIVMTHQTKEGEPKVVSRVTLPLTAPRAVDRIITDVAVMDVTSDGLVLRECVPGWTPDDIQAITEATLHVPDDVTEMTLA